MIRKLLLATSIIALAAVPAAAQTGLPVGTAAPDARVQTMDGKPVQLARYIAKDRPTLIEFWATWCGNCKALEPQMHAAGKKFAGKVAMVGVAVGVNQSAELVKRFAAKHRLPLTIVYDATGDAADKYDVPATSYIVVLDKSGKIVYTGVGAEQDVEAAIRKAL